MSHQLHRVKRGPPARIFAMKDRWHECVFTEAETGDEFTVTYAGKHMPSVAWPEGRDMDKERKPARLHLSRRT